MNGETLNKELLPFGQNKRQLKVLKIKFLLGIILSNIMVIMLMNILTPEASQVELATSTHWPPHLPEKDYVFLSIPLELYIPLDALQQAGKSGKSISLFSDDKKLLIAKAYLFPLLAASKQENNFGEYSEHIAYTVGVPANEVQKIIQAKAKYFLAYPRQQQLDASQSAQTKRRNYELVF